MTNKDLGNCCTPAIIQDDLTCSLLRLYNFGEGVEDMEAGPPVAYNYYDFIEALRRSVKHFPYSKWDKVSDFALIQAEVLTTQPRARRFLRRMKFQETVCDSYLKYPKHGISHFVMPVAKFLEILETTPTKSKPKPSTETAK